MNFDKDEVTKKHQKDMDELMKLAKQPSIVNSGAKRRAANRKSKIKK